MTQTTWRPTSPYSSSNSRTMANLLLPWFMWGMGALFYFYEFLVQVSPNVMAPDLMQDFNVTAKSLGLLAGVYFYSYALMQIPAGVLLDKLGPHRLLAIASSVLALGCFLFSTVHSFSLALLARLFIGFGSAFAVIGCMKLAANWFPVNRFALMIGLTVAIGMCGAIIGEAPLAVLVEAIHWRSSMLYLSVVGLVIGLIFLFLVRDHPHHKVITSSCPDVQVHTFKSVFTSLLEVIRSKQIWLVALYGCLMFAPTITFCGLWGAPFLMIKCQIDTKDAAAMVSLVFVGWIVGSPFIGWVSDRIGKRLPPMVLGSLGALICIILVLYQAQSITTLSVLLFCFGFCSSGFLPAFSIIRESSPSHVSASALGFMNMMNTLGIALTQPLVGIWLDAIWSGQMNQGLPVYALAEYQQAMLPLPIALLGALVIVCCIQETDCKIKHQ